MLQPRRLSKLAQRETQPQRAIADQLQDTHQAQEPERPDRAQIQTGHQIERQDGEQIDQAEEGEDIGQLLVGHRDPGQIFDGENEDAADLEHVQCSSDGFGKTGQRPNGERDER
jgi:hypothetical protein